VKRRCLGSRHPGQYTHCRSRTKGRAGTLTAGGWSVKLVTPLQGGSQRIAVGAGGPLTRRAKGVTLKGSRGTGMFHGPGGGEKPPSPLDGSLERGYIEGLASEGSAKRVDAAARVAPGGCPWQAESLRRDGLTIWVLGMCE
jgi:hypothetical protein